MSQNKIIGPMLMTCGLLAASSSYAQDAATTDEGEDIFELSPFTVSNSSDNGYYATQTLAGSRIKTNVRDLAASISIVTEDFLDDTNATDLADILIFQGNTEVSGLGGNFSGTQGYQAGAIIPEFAASDTTGGLTRVRGLPVGADLARDYFATRIPMDSYNTERVTVSRGANAVLFGLGSPAGVINNSLLKARMVDDGRLRFRTDQFGSTRLELRKTSVLVEDKFALTVAGLLENEKFEQEEAHMEDRRLYLAGLFTPSEGLSIRFNIENGERKGAQPDFMPPADMITPYFQSADRRTFTDAKDAGDYYGSGTDSNGTPGNRIVYPYGDLGGGTIAWMDPNSATPEAVSGTMRLYAYDGLASAGSYNAITNPNGRSPTGNLWMNYPRNEWLSLNSYGQRADGTTVESKYKSTYDTFTGKQITDRSIFDYRKHLLDGGRGTIYNKFDALNLSVEKTFWDNRAAIELAYNSEKVRDAQLGQSRGRSWPGGRALYLEINEFFGAEEPSVGDGVTLANDNFGGVTVFSRGDNEMNTTERETIRFTGNVQLRASDFLEEDSFLEKLLGVADLTGLAQTNNRENYQIYAKDTGEASDYIGTWGTEIADFRHNDSMDVFGYHALDYNGRSDGVKITDFTSVDQLKGLNIQPVNGLQVTPASQTFRLLDMASQTYKEGEVDINTIMRNGALGSAYGAGKTSVDVDSLVFNGTFRFWDDLVVLQRAWRKDVVNSVDASAPSFSDYKNRRDLNDPSFVLPSANSEDDEESQVRTWGVVVHTPDFIKEKLPNGLEFDLHMGEGSNFDASGGSANRRDLFGDPIAAVGGDTKEYGFSVYAFDGKLATKVNFYETALVNSSSGIQGGMTYGTANAIVAMIQQSGEVDNAGFSESDILAALPSQKIIDLHNITYDLSTHFAQAGLSSRSATRDLKAEGVEVEVLYSPTSNWTNLLKVSQQETVNSNTGLKVKEFIDTFIKPTWIDSSFGQNYIMNTNGDTLAYYAQTVIVDDYTRKAAQDGIPSAEQREWRMIATSKYRFENMFNNIGASNFTVGGTLRWEDELGIGFDLMQNQFGEWVSDPNAVYTADAETYLDMFVSMDAKVFGQDTNFRLYVSDLTNHDGLTAISANEDGSESYRFSEGRVVSLSASVSF